MFGFFDADMTVLIQPLSKRFRERAWHVLYQKNRIRKAFRQYAKYFLQCYRTACRSAYSETAITLSAAAYLRDDLWFYLLTPAS